MKYWQIIYRTGEEDWETKELLIDDNQYQLVQKALINGEDMIVILGKPSIKRTSITSINEASNIVGEYQKLGLKVDGLLEPVDVPKLTGNVKSEREFAREKIASIKDELKTKSWWK